MGQVDRRKDNYHRYHLCDIAGYSFQGSLFLVQSEDQSLIKSQDNITTICLTEEFLWDSRHGRSCITKDQRDAAPLVGRMGYIHVQQESGEEKIIDTYE